MNEQIIVGSVWIANTSCLEFYPGKHVEVIDINNGYISVIPINSIDLHRRLFNKYTFRLCFNHLYDQPGAAPQAAVKSQCPVVKPTTEVAVVKQDFVGSHSLPIDLDYDNPWDNCVAYKRS